MKIAWDFLGRERKDERKCRRALVIDVSRLSFEKGGIEREKRIYARTVSFHFILRER